MSTCHFGMTPDEFCEKHITLTRSVEDCTKSELIYRLVMALMEKDKLEEDNQKLKAHNDEMEEKLTNMTDEEAKRCESYWEEEKQRMLDEVASLQSEVEDKQNEIEKLEEENEALKDEVNDRVVIEDIAHLFDKDEEGDDFDWEDEINDMIIENNELKEEIEELKDENVKLEEAIGDELSEKQELEEKNEELKEQNRKIIREWALANLERDESMNDADKAYMKRVIQSQKNDDIQITFH